MLGKLIHQEPLIDPQKIMISAYGRNPEKIASFSRFFPGPHVLAFNLFDLFISLRSKLINKIKVSRG